MNLNQIGLPTTDIAASSTFYRKLGFVPVVDTPEYARFKRQEGPATFSLLKAPGSIASGVTLYFEVSNVEEVVRRLQGQGITFTEEPKRQSWGWTEARLKDPSGNSLCIFLAGQSRLNPNN